ncbi:MAG: radical SAM protein [Acidobacteria bacterium]|nr:radical SAM protein [Acidobacteriota bacterium]MCI0628199.1 radical SAM protein [Acidobacteriota bacterium]MCI0719626.1 radical SAM protein [Acidobacteriota bacterium]
MKINEIYYSIQGESSYAGLPCVFVRLTYCNLRCAYCDTAYAFYEGKDMSVDEVLAAVRGYDCPLVEVTGGEPLLQKEVFPLMDRLVGSGCTVLLETGGSLDVAQVHPQVIKIVDLKCPSSGECQHNLYSNLDKLQPYDEIKFVIGTREDYLWSKATMEKYRLSDRFPVLFSTVFDKLEPRQLVEWVLQDRLKVRFQLQMHKYIWEPASRGV